MSAEETSRGGSIKMTDAGIAMLEKQHLALGPEELMQISSDFNLIIGPNGAGKTRLLNFIKDVFESCTNADVLYGYFPNLSPSGRISKTSVPEFSLKEFVQKDNVTFDDFFKEIESQHRSFLTRLLDPESLNQAQENESLLKAVCSSFELLTKKRLYQYTPPKGPGARKDPKPVLRVSDPSGGSPDMTLTDALKLFSPGERMLFYMSLFFALRRDPAADHEQVIILDEPEAHLHPDALIKFVTGLREYFPKSNIMIATHSLFLLPLFAFEDIIYMENGHIVRRDSQLYEKILSSMLGPRRGDVNRFFASLPYWQYCDFIAECFTDPEVVSGVDPKDPQTEIFIKALQEHKFKKVLDYGGGSGRLGKNVEAAKAHNWKDVQYHIFDTVKRDAGDGVKVITDWGDAATDYNCIVMMNVLHEMDPNGSKDIKGWVDTFADIRTHMASEGFLLFVEVETLRTGEYPNDTGYLLLGPEQLQILFRLPTPPQELRSKNGKHRGFLIPRDKLGKVNSASVDAAINDLEMHTYSEIQKMRAQGKNQTNARRYAFLLQQHMNAMLFNEEQGNESTGLLLQASGWHGVDTCDI